MSKLLTMQENTRGTPGIPGVSFNFQKKTKGAKIIMEKLKVLSLFSGIGAFEKALEREKIPHEVVAYCEIDKYASKSYSTIHNIPESLNLGDISKVATSDIPEYDLVTYGFPCQDISVAGLQKGIKAGETRSGLLYEALRIIEAKKPKYAIAENVKNLVGKRFKGDFEQLLELLDNMGYNSYWQVLNAKDYGIPQNRERVFIISIRKDIDNGCFVFPNTIPLETRMRDYLEDEVDEKYYLKDTKDFFIRHSLEQEAKGNGFRFSPHIKKNAEIAATITTKAGSRMDDNYVLDIDYPGASFNFEKKNMDKVVKLIRIGNIYGDHHGTGYAGNVWDTNGLCPTLMTMQGGGRQPMIINNLRIRKLTPKECFRLMGFDDNDVDKCSNVGMSNTQLYKQAGNSIVVNVLQAIFRELF